MELITKMSMSEELYNEVLEKRKEMSERTLNQICEDYFTESHLVATQFLTFLEHVGNKMLSHWVKNGAMMEDFDRLVEYIEIGMAKMVPCSFTFMAIMNELKKSVDDSTSLHYLEEEDCENCDGTGYEDDGLSFRCSECVGTGNIEITVFLTWEESISRIENSVLRIERKYWYEAIDLIMEYYDEGVEVEEIEKALKRYENSKRVKPKCKLIGEDGNIFNLIGVASKVLKKNGMHEEAKEMSEHVFMSNSYNEALSIITDYVTAY